MTFISDTQSPSPRLVGRLARLAIVVTLVSAFGGLLEAQAQGLVEARRLYEAGKYRQAVDLIVPQNPTATDSPRLVYLEALSYERLGDGAQAERLYLQLGAAGAAWQGVGLSAQHLLHQRPSDALAAATQAVAAEPALAEAQYQLGLAASLTDDFAGAARAFDRAAEIDAQWAHAFYYAGLAYSKLKRVDLLAARFETFLSLAPGAPERPQLESIMRTLRGR